MRNTPSPSPKIIILNIHSAKLHDTNSRKSPALIKIIKHKHEKKHIEVSKLPLQKIIKKPICETPKPTCDTPKPLIQRRQVFSYSPHFNMRTILNTPINDVKIPEINEYNKREEIDQKLQSANSLPITPYEYTHYERKLIERKNKLVTPHGFYISTATSTDDISGLNNSDYFKTTSTNPKIKYQEPEPPKPGYKQLTFPELLLDKFDNNNNNNNAMKTIDSKSRKCMKKSRQMILFQHNAMNSGNISINSSILKTVSYSTKNKGHLTRNLQDKRYNSSIKIVDMSNIFKHRK